MIRWPVRSAARCVIALSLLAPLAMTIGAARTSASNAGGCERNFGTATPVLLVHGFHEQPTGPSGVWTSGTLSMEDAIAKIPSVKVVTPFDYYSTANSATNWVTAPTIGAALASDIICLANASTANGGPGKVIIVAHSMGGLAVRCAVDPACLNRVNTGKPWPAANVNQIGLVITLGTPNLGSTLAAKTAPFLDSALCEEIPRCPNFAAAFAGNSAAAAALEEGSPELDPNYQKPDPNLLKSLPASIPLYAIAGKVTLTTSLFGSPFDISIGDIGDVAVPVNSALAEAPPVTAHSGSASGSATIDCGTIPIDHLDLWRATSGILHTGIPYLTCWHLTETTDPTWQADVVTAIQRAARALSLRACTAAAIGPALAAKDPTSAAQRTLVTFACNGGWALAEVHQPLTLSDGSVVQDTAFAILRQGNAGWSSEGLNDGTCLHSGLCPGYALPPPAILQLLLQKTGIRTATTQAQLYINTVFTPGALYRYPTGPTKIGIDNHNWIDGLQWRAGSQGDLVGTGTLHYDDCKPSCAGGTYEAFSILITASSPRQCTVQLYPNGAGNPSQTVQAEVFSQLGIQALQGNPPSFILDDPALTRPCAQSQPTQHSPAPFAVTSSNPTSGPASGGTLIVIHGSGFSSVTKVVMNSIEPPLPIGSPNYNLQNLHPRFSVVSDSEIDVTTTAGAAGFTYEIDFITPTDEYFRNTYPGIPLFTYK